VQKYFIALKQGLTSKATLIEVNPNLTVEQNFSLNDDLIIDNKKDYYTSLYYYNEAQKSIFEQTGSFAGIKDTQSNRLFFDLDSKDLKEAQKQSTALALDLVNYGISEESIHCSFTGSKGFCLEVYLTEFINPVHLKSVLILVLRLPFFTFIFLHPIGYMVLFSVLFWISVMVLQGAY